MHAFSTNQIADILDFNDKCRNYLNEVFQTGPENNIQTRESLQKLKCPFRKTNAGQMLLSCIGPTI